MFVREQNAAVDVRARGGSARVGKVVWECATAAAVAVACATLNEPVPDMENGFLIRDEPLWLLSNASCVLRVCLFAGASPVCGPPRSRVYGAR